MRAKPKKIYHAYQGKGRSKEKTLRTTGIAFVVILLLFLVCFLNHRMRLSAENKLLLPPGTMVDVDGRQMHIYTEGSGGTGFSEDVWRNFQRDYPAGAENTRYVELDCPHYVHDHEYQRINREIRDFIQLLY